MIKSNGKKVQLEMLSKWFQSTSSKANQCGEILYIECARINIKYSLSYSSCISFFSFPLFLTWCSKDFLLVPTNISFWQTVQIKRYG